MRIKISELNGAALDYAVALALGLRIRSQKRDGVHKGAFIAVGDAYNYIWRDTMGWMPGGTYSWSPSTRWEHGGPLIGKFKIDIEHQGNDVLASIYKPHGLNDVDYFGSTGLIAICRAVVACKLGDYEVDVPDELLRAA